MGDRAVGLQRSQGIEGATVYQCDLSDEGSVKSVIERLNGVQFTHLIHTAGITPWAKNTDFTEDLVFINSILFLCHQLHIPNLVNLSGWNVYDMEGKAPFSELTTIKPVGEYGESKYKIEQLLDEKSGSTRILNLRLASIYGPGQASPGLIPNSVKSALESGNILLQSLSTKRDYLYVDDLVEAIDNIVSTKSFTDGVLNIGSGKSVSVFEIAQAIKETIESEYNQTITIETASTIQESTLSDNQLDISKAKTLGLLEHVHSISEGLLNYIRWMKNENIL